MPRFQIVFQGPGRSRAILVDDARPANGAISHQGKALVVGSVVRIDGADWLVSQQSTVGGLLRFVCVAVELPAG